MNGHMRRRKLPQYEIRQRDYYLYCIDAETQQILWWKNEIVELIVHLRLSILTYYSSVQMALKLHYFALRARNEAIQMILHHGKIPYEFLKIETDGSMNSHWVEIKKSK